MDLAEQGLQDALARKEASSLEPEYQIGYADGVQQRAHTAGTNFSDTTIDGDRLNVVRQPGSAVFYASIQAGTVQERVGRFTSLEEGVVACLDALKSRGRITVRPAAIERHLANSHPELSEDERQRIATKVVAYVQGRRKR